MFEECLAALRASQDARYELIVLNDASTDDSAGIARKYSCRLSEFTVSLGPSHARNEGGKMAEGEILLFIDADIIVPPHTLKAISGIFRNNNVVAITGVLSESIRYHNFSSQYKNLWMRYSYLEMPDQVSLFYTSIAAIRREVFLSTGGFDTGYSSPSLEDTDFGQRLETEGYPVHLRRELEVEHVKHYTLSGLVRTDFRRSAAMVKMTLRKGLNRFMRKGNKTSVRTSFMVGVALFSLACSALLGGMVVPSLMTGVVSGKGPYCLRISDAQRKGGKDFIYRLDVRAPRPDVALRVVPSCIVARPGAVVPITVHAVRREGFDDPIHLSLVEPPEGFKLDGAVVPGKADQVRLTLTIPPVAPKEPFLLEMDGQSLGSSRHRRFTRPVIPAESLMQAFLWLQIVPAEQWAILVNGQPAAKPPLELLPVERINLRPGAIQ